MRKYVLDIAAAAFIFLAIFMIVAAAGMMDQGAEILICIKLIVGSMLAVVVAAGLAGLQSAIASQDL